MTASPSYDVRCADCPPAGYPTDKTRCYGCPLANTYKDATGELVIPTAAPTSNEQLQRDLELAYQMLEANGVSRQRARSVHNGVGVLSARWARLVNDEQQVSARLRTALERCRLESGLAKAQIIDEALSGAGAPVETSAALKPDCADCGLEYGTDDWLDTVLSLEQWKLIGGEQAGILCANCMVRRASRLPDVVNFSSRITFRKDFHGPDHDVRDELVPLRCSSVEPPAECDHPRSEFLASKGDQFEMRKCLECTKIFRVRLRVKASGYYPGPTDCPHGYWKAHCGICLSENGTPEHD